MRSRRNTALVLALTAALGLTACGSGTATTSSTPAGTSGSSAPAGDDALTVVASTNVYGSIATAIAGDAATVTSLIEDPSVDPHSFEASTRTQLELSRADVVIENGGGYDDFVGTLLEAAEGADPVVVNAVELSGDDPDAEGFNEHVWYDLPTVRAVADAVEAALVEAAPEQEDAFRANADALDGQLAQLQQRVADAAPSVDGAPVLVTEPVPGHLLDALGAQDRTPAAFSEAVESEVDAPAAAVQETLDLLRARQVRALVVNEQTSGPQTEQALAAAREAEVTVVPVTETLPQGQDYVTWMGSTVDALVAALRA